MYEHLVYDGEVHNSILKFPELFKHSFVCFSFGKLYHCTGWKVGYCIAPARLMLEYKKVHQYNAFSTNTPAQYGLANFLTKKDKYLSLSGFFQEKRDYFLKLLSETRFKPNHPKGSYFICCSYDAYSYQSDIAFVFDLIKNTGVAAIPLSSFYANNEDQGIIRFCFAKKIETLETGVERLLKLNSGTHFR